MLSQTAVGQFTRKKVNVVIIDIPVSEWNRITPFGTDLNEEGVEAMTVQTLHPEGLLPRVAELKRVCRAGPVADWIAELVGELEESGGFATGVEEAPKTAKAQRAASRPQQAQAASIGCQSATSAHRQQMARGLMANGRPVPLVGGPRPKVSLVGQAAPVDVNANAAIQVRSIRCHFKWRSC
jgi:hypothetical protein